MAQSQWKIIQKTSSLFRRSEGELETQKNRRSILFLLVEQRKHWVFYFSNIDSNRRTSISACSFRNALSFSSSRSKWAASISAIISLWRLSAFFSASDGPWPTGLAEHPASRTSSKNILMGWLLGCFALGVSSIRLYFFWFRAHRSFVLRRLGIAAVRGLGLVLVNWVANFLVAT